MSIMFIITRSAQYAVSVIKQSSVRPSVCPVDQQQRRSAGLLLRSGAGSSYRVRKFLSDCKEFQHMPTCKFMMCIGPVFEINATTNVPGSGPGHHCSSVESVLVARSSVPDPATKTSEFKTNI